MQQHTPIKVRLELILKRMMSKRVTRKRLKKGVEKDRKEIEKSKESKNEKVDV